MMILSVTGGIGSGKSSFARALASALASDGFHLIDADSIVSEMLGSSEGQALALEVFGSSDRARIRELAWSNPDLLSVWEARCAPLWRSRAQRRLDAHPFCVWDAPLLHETGFLLGASDLVIEVHAPEALCDQRAMARLGWDDARVRQARARQASGDSKSAGSDLRILNDGDLSSLAGKAQSLADQIRWSLPWRSRGLLLLGDEGWRRTLSSHAQPFRGYHHWQHLSEMLSLIERHADHPDLLASRDALWLAALFHDQVYSTDPSRLADNERLSAELMWSCARDRPSLLDGSRGEPPALVASEMILATRSHRLSEWQLQSPSRSLPARFFLDADLSILAADPDRLASYDEGIRHEFRSIPPSIFHAKRAEALRHLFAKDRLFLSPWLSSLESQARLNLSALIETHERQAQEAGSPSS